MGSIALDAEVFVVPWDRTDQFLSPSDGKGIVNVGVGGGVGAGAAVLTAVAAAAVAAGAPLSTRTADFPAAAVRAAELAGCLGFGNFAAATTASARGSGLAVLCGSAVEVLGAVVVGT